MEQYTQKLPKINLILIVVSLVVIVVGFILMIGEPSGATEFNPDIYSTRRITVGPMVAFFGFIMMIFAIMFKQKSKNDSTDSEELTKKEEI